MKTLTWKLAGLAILVIGLAAALVSITTAKIVSEQAASSNTKTGSNGGTSGTAQKKAATPKPPVPQP